MFFLKTETFGYRKAADVQVIAKLVRRESLKTDRKGCVTWKKRKHCVKKIKFVKILFLRRYSCTLVSKRFLTV